MFPLYTDGLPSGRHAIDTRSYHCYSSVPATVLI
ncbi:hypothetical protein TNCV_1102121, partial [Trichonephila clavipes]